MKWIWNGRSPHQFNINENPMINERVKIIDSNDFPEKLKI
jgi:hypothetical protein